MGSTAVLRFGKQRSSKSTIHLTSERDPNVTACGQPLDDRYCVGAEPWHEADNNTCSRCSRIAWSGERPAVTEAYNVFAERVVAYRREQEEKQRLARKRREEAARQRMREYEARQQIGARVQELLQTMGVGVDVEITAKESDGSNVYATLPIGALLVLIQLSVDNNKSLLEAMSKGA